MVPMTPAAKRWTLWVVLAVGTGAAAVHVTLRERAARIAADAGTGAAGERLGSPRNESGVTQLLAQIGRTRLSPEVLGKPFASGGWTAPTSEVSKPSGPPPFGYVYAGRLKDESGARVYLARQNGDEVIRVKPGDKLDGGYEVLGIEGDRIDLIWSPGKQKLSMQLSSLVAPPAPGTPSAAAPAFGQPGMVSSAQTSLVAVAKALSASAEREDPNPAPAAPNMPGYGFTPPTQALQAPRAQGPALGVAPTSSGMLGAPPTSNLASIGTAPQSSSMPMSNTPAGSMAILPPPSGKLGN